MQRKAGTGKEPARGRTLRMLRPRFARAARVYTPGGLHVANHVPLMHALPDFSAASVLVAGDAMLDLYWHGPTSRISPEAPVPVVHVHGAEERAGGAANVAVNLATLGVRSTLLAFVGEDEEGAKLAHRLDQSRVEHRLVRIPGARTISKLRVLSRHQQLLRLDFEDGFDGADAALLLDPLRSMLRDARALVLSDYGKGTLRDMRACIGAARAAGVPVFVDPKGRDFSIYRGASVITPNLAEFEAVAGRAADEADLVRRAARLRAELELDALLVTRGEHGMTLVRGEGDARHFPVEAREVFDVTGAGDTVIAVLAGAVAAGADHETACRIANVAAGIVVARLGTAAPTPEELSRALAGGADAHAGLLDEDTAACAIAAARARGERIVLTNGCFDLLHPGHIAVLEAARAHGDRLVVALNDDESVRRLKGDGRPLCPLMHRAAVLAALSAVDWVVPFSEDTPERLIRHLAPDVLVKGGDYREEDIAGAAFVRERGGEVVIVAIVKGCSTTALVERIRNES